MLKTPLIMKAQLCSALRAHKAQHYARGALVFQRCHATVLHDGKLHVACRGRMDGQAAGAEAADGQGGAPVRQVPHAAQEGAADDHRAAACQPGVRQC